MKSASPPYMHRHVSIGGMVSWQKDLEYSLILGEKCEGEPPMDLLIDTVGSHPFTLTDSRNSLSIRVIPLKKFQMAVKL